MRGRGPASHETPAGSNRSDVRRWRRYLADERAEAAIYRDLAERRSGQEREILLALAEAEGRHEEHWRQLLGHDVGRPHRVGVKTRILGVLARHFGSVFVLALAQRAEGRSPYDADAHATAEMAADERVHEEVIRSLAARGRSQLSGRFRAAIFGANDGLVSNLALIMAIGAANVSTSVVLFSGISGLLAGALSMGAGEYISVRSQRELLDASSPSDEVRGALAHLDVNANELSLVFRARGLNPESADRQAQEVLKDQGSGAATATDSKRPDVDQHEQVGTAIGAALSSFCFFASGAIIPILPFAIGFDGLVAMATSAALVGVALTITGMVVAVLTGGSPLRCALRQLAIGYGAAALTFGLGTVFGAHLS